MTKLSRQQQTEILSGIPKYLEGIPSPVRTNQNEAIVNKIWEQFHYRKIVAGDRFDTPNHLLFKS